MSKKNINFEKMSRKALNQIKAFAVSRIKIAKEDRRHNDVQKVLYAKLDAIHESRENDLKQGFSQEDVLRKFPSIEVENALRQERDLHDAISEPLRSELNSTYVFMPDGLYEAYVKKLEEGKRGDFLDSIRGFLAEIGIEEVSQSALCRLSENISDKIGGCVTTSKVLLKDGKFSCKLRKPSFNKLFMSVFCDILTYHNIMDIDDIKERAAKEETKEVFKGEKETVAEATGTAA